MMRVAVVFVMGVALVSPAFAQTATGPSIAEQALGAEVMACVQSRVALRAEIIGLQHAAALGSKPAEPAPPETPASH